jgi:ABC-2 type transport system ATP-binding protein
MLKLTNIKKVFKTDLLSQPFVALDNVSFDIPDGAIVGFLGANGAGKTTSLKIIMDFIRADSGSVEFSDRLGSSKLEIFKKIGFLPERPYFYPNLTGKEFLIMLGTLSETPRAVLDKNILFWAERFSIAHALPRQLKTYSKGMLQRIGFLASILHDPEFVILDEPLSGLDPIGRKELKDVIVELHKTGKTIFFSSHVVPDIEEMCDRVIFLEKGKLVYDGSVQALIHSSPTEEISFKVRASADVYQRLKQNDLSISDGDLGSGFYLFRAAVKNKDQILKIIIDSGSELISLEPQKLTLEEIFYKIKQHDK